MQYICKKSGWTENGKQWTHCRELFVELWRNLQDTADRDDDGQITVDEWVSIVTYLLRHCHRVSSVLLFVVVIHMYNHNMVNNRSFQYATPYLWSQLPTELREPRQILPPSRSPPITHGCSSSPSSLSPLYLLSLWQILSTIALDLFLTYRTDSTDSLPI